MKICRFSYDTQEYLGIYTNGGVVNLGEVFDYLDDVCPKNILELIENFNEEKFALIEGLVGRGKFNHIEKDKIKFLSPIPYPKRNLFCLGKNYMEHAKEMDGKVGSDIPEHPIYFSKIANPSVGDNDFIESHGQLTEMLDYEVELAVIIGKEGINIKKEDALDHVFGYTIANDISARDLQNYHVQWLKGKSLSTFCPLGPVVVLKDEIENPNNLDIKCWVNSDIRQESNTKNMIFDIPTIIEDLSREMVLNVGDIILTGTPAGVGMAFDPPKYLKKGDKIKCYIEKIGYLGNEVR
ncbi:MAG: fumarylacetoacetate hydrolase family protein [Firmicutes bacterium]|jgi:2-keto-4-pentenoate hydratase/2-oxohepta-3-ene-1,7-dioic acid hydratase in catechol pathway|nr:fumarylacetoacetate hydrolase family protein [Bacillota bacterium]